MKCLSRDEFLDADDLPLKPVPLPEDLYGKESGVFVRMMTGTERGAIEKLWAGSDPADDPASWRADILLACVTDESGALLFQEADREPLMGKRGLSLETIVEAATKLNGYTAGDVEDIAKNSATARSS